MSLYKLAPLESATKMLDGPQVQNRSAKEWPNPLAKSKVNTLGPLFCVLTWRKMRLLSKKLLEVEAARKRLSPSSCKSLRNPPMTSQNMIMTQLNEIWWDFGQDGLSPKSAWRAPFGPKFEAGWQESELFFCPLLFWENFFNQNSVREADSCGIVHDHESFRDFFQVSCWRLLFWQKIMYSIWDYFE